jgi:hypothetical protein
MKLKVSGEYLGVSPGGDLVRASSLSRALENPRLDLKLHYSQMEKDTKNG